MEWLPQLLSREDALELRCAKIKSNIYRMAAAGSSDPARIAGMRWRRYCNLSAVKQDLEKKVTMAKGSFLEACTNSLCVELDHLQPSREI